MKRLPEKGIYLTSEREFETDLKNHEPLKKPDPMKYIIYREKKRGRRFGFVATVLSYFFPGLYALDRYARLFNQVSYWYLEINETGKVNREIGFNAIDDAIVIAPWRGNLGNWSESNVTFKPNEHEHLSELEFMNTWRDVEQKTLTARRFVAGKAREYYEGKISWKDFFDHCHFNYSDKLIGDLVNLIEHDPFYSKSGPSSHDDHPRETYDWEIRAMINDLEK